MDTRYVDSRIADAKKIANLIVASVPDDVDHESYPAIADGINQKDWKNHPDKLRMKRTMDKELRKLKKLKGEVRYKGKYTFEKEKRALECKRLRDTLIEKMGIEDYKNSKVEVFLDFFIGLMKDSAINRTISFTDFQPEFIAVIDRIGGYIVFPARLTKLKMGHNGNDKLQEEVIKNSCQHIRLIIGDKIFGFR